MSLNREATTLDLLSSVEAQGVVDAPSELAGLFDPSIVNDNLIRLYVRAFGWEVNRNNFLFNKNALLAEHTDALGQYIPAWKSFEKQLVNANHLMKDNQNSKVDRVIGFIEDAELKDDGVYLTLVAWKRTLSDDEIGQIRDGNVSVSMEVRYTNPQVIVDGKTYPPHAISYDPRSVIRTMADDSVLSFIGIAVLFNNIAPGFGSAEVILQENAQEGSDALVSRDTQTEVSMEKTELEQQLAELQSKNTELASALENRESELASAQAELLAKRQELDKICEELEALRVARFNEAVAANFDLGKLTADTAAWLLDMIRWSGDVDSTAAKLAEIAGSVKIAPKETSAASIEDCQDGSCGECSACKKKKEMAEANPEAGAGDPAPSDVAPTESASSQSDEGNPPAEEPAAQVENAAAAEAPLVNLAGEGGEGPRYNHSHL